MNQEELKAFIANLEAVKKEAMEAAQKNEQPGDKQFFSGCMHTLNVVLIRLYNFVDKEPKTDGKT